MTKTKPQQEIGEELVKRAGTSSGSLASKVKMHDWLLVGIVIVVVVAFSAMLVTAGAMVNDSLAEKKATSKEIEYQIRSQNDKIDALTKALQEAQKPTPQPAPAQ